MCDALRRRCQEISMTSPRFAPFVVLSSLAMSCAYWSDNGVKKVEAPPRAATEAASSPDSSPRKPADEDVLRLVGSTTVGSRLAPNMVLAYLGSVGAKDVTTRPSPAGATHTTISAKVDSKPVTFEIDFPGSGAAFECLGEGKCDIGMSSRPIQPEEAEKLKALGDLTDDASEHVLAMDGLAVVVGRNNPLTKLTVQQVGQIFAGEARSWSQVGGAGGEIHVVTRDKTSGTYDTFSHLALAGRDVTARAKVVETNEAVAKAVAADDAAIGFVALPYVAGTKPLLLQDGIAAALAPTVLNVGTEDYAFARRLFFYTPSAPKNPLAQKLVEFALSDAGQAVVEETGFVSLNVRSSAVAAPSDAPPAYVKATGGAQRLTFNFRFKGSTAKLDPRSVKDLERMARFIKVASSNARSVALLGFTDNQGPEPKNVELSRQRATAIAEQLRGRGIEPQVVDGFGSALPVAPNDTPRGRSRNRRIEVWLR
jgi:phosphate transport system substrate-binding protein